MSYNYSSEKDVSTDGPSKATTQPASESTESATLKTAPPSTLPNSEARTKLQQESQILSQRTTHTVGQAEAKTQTSPEQIPASASSQQQPAQEEVSFIGKLWNQTKKNVKTLSEVASKGLSVAKGLVEDEESRKASMESIKKLTSKAASMAKSGVEATTKFLQNNGQAIGDGLAAIGETTVDLMGNTLKFAATAATSGAAITKDLVTGNTAEISSHFSKVSDSFLTMVKTPVDALGKHGGKALEFLGNAAEGLGIDDIGAGFSSFVKGGSQILKHSGLAVWELGRDITTGNWSQLGQNFSKNASTVFESTKDMFVSSGQFFRGAGRFVAEISGAADAWRAVQAYAEGDMKGFAWYTAMGGAQFGALLLGGVGGFALAGGRGAARKGVAIMVREGMEKIAVSSGKEVAEKVGAKLSQKLTKEAAERFTKDISEFGIKLSTEATQQLRKEGFGAIVQRELGEGIARTSGEAFDETLDSAVKVLKKAEGKSSFADMSLEQVQKYVPDQKVVDITSGKTEQVMGRVLDEVGLEDIVAETVEKDLHRLSRMKASKIKEELVEQGYDPSKAGKAAKHIKKSLSNGKLDKELKLAYENSITKEVTEELNEKSLKTMRESFEKTWDDELLRLQKKYKFSDEVMDHWKKLGRKGYAKGVDSAVRTRVKKGIDTAFKKFRRHRGNYDFDLDKKKAKELEFDDPTHIKSKHAALDQEGVKDEILDLSTHKKTDDESIWWVSHAEKAEQQKLQSQASLDQFKKGKELSEEPAIGARSLGEQFQEETRKELAQKKQK